MNFANPAALWGLLALLVPIAVHLFSFRTSKRVLFSNLELLREIKEQSSKRQLLKERLLLLSRLLAILSLVLAFAQPYWGDEKRLINPGNRFHSIFLDNSQSMLLEGSEGLLLEQARAVARSIALAAHPNERFHLLTHDFAPQSQRWLSRDAFLLALDEVRPAFVSRTPTEILSRQLDAIHGKVETNKVQFYWISDFQKSAMPLDALDKEKRLNMRFLQLQPQEVANVYVDTAWLESPVIRMREKNRLLFRLKNGGRTNANGVVVQLRVNEVQKGLANLDIAAGSSVVDTIDFTLENAGVFAASLDLDDRTFAFDDRWYMQFKVESELPLLYAQSGSPSPFIMALFKNDDFVKMEETQSLRLDMNQLNLARALIVEGLDASSTGLLEALRNQVEAGAALLYLPGTKESPENLRKVLGYLTGGQVGALVESTTPVRKLDFDDKLFQETFSRLPEQMMLPTAKKYFEYKPHPADRVLMELANEAPWLIRRSLGEGNILVLLSALDPTWTDLPQQALFVPTVYRAVQLSGGLLPSSFRMRDALSIELSSSNLPAEGILTLVGKENSWVPEVRRFGNRVRLNLMGQKLSPGHYALFAKNKQVDGLLFALNSDELESQFTYYEEAELNSWAETRGWQQETVRKATLVGKTLETATTGTAWKWLLLAVLIFLISELTILKFLR